MSSATMKQVPNAESIDMYAKIFVACWLRVISLLLILALTSSCVQPIQAPIADLPGVRSEEEVTFKNGDITLAGTLTLPAAQGLHPALILISGSGQQDRNEAIQGVPGYKPFQLIADYLTQQGIAVLRYDDRGVGGSSGDPTRATTADFALDAEAALNFLLDRADINHSKIGFLGHSEGSIIAAMIAARNPNVAFVISMAGPAVRGYDLLLVQTERILSTVDMTKEARDQAMDGQKQALALTMTEEWDELEAMLLEVGHQQIEAMPEAQKKALGDPDAFLQKQIDISMLNMQHWLHFFLIHNPADNWAQITIPVLALFGGLDTQVDQAQNRPALEVALTQAGNADVTIKVFEEANHLFQKAKTGSPEEYAMLSVQFIPGFLDTIGEWLLARTTGAELHQTENNPATTAHMEILFEPDLLAGTVASAEMMEATRDMIEWRMVGLGITLGFVKRQGDQRILVVLPVQNNTERVVEFLGSTSSLEFVDPGQFTLHQGMIINTTNTPNAVKEAQSGVDAGQLLPSQLPYPDHVFQTVFTSDIFQTAIPMPDQHGQWQISLKTTHAGAEKLGEYTASHINQPLVFVLEGQVISAPIIQAPISEQMALTGSFTQEEASQLAWQIRYGALPVPLKLIDVRTVQD